MKQLEFTTLKIILAVADSGSLSAAAEKSNIAVAAVSKRITDLEASAGTQFFARHARGVTLTPAGRALVQHAREIIFGVERMNSDLSHYAKGVKGIVRIAATSSAVSEFLPGEIKTFVQSHPDIDIDLAEWTAQGVVEAVMDGRADLGIFLESEAGDELVTFPYRQDSLCVVVPKGHELAARPSVRLADLLTYDFIGTRPQSSLARKLMAESAGQLRVRLRVQTSDAACRMAQAGLGIFVAPRLIVQPYPRIFDVELVELDEPWAQRQMLVGVRSEAGLSKAAAAFLAQCVAAGGPATVRGR
jgi:DNA-binding transcriptional LysR family regulator